MGNWSTGFGDPQNLSDPPNQLSYSLQPLGTANARRLLELTNATRVQLLKLSA